jgi:hypothetical protein
MACSHHGKLRTREAGLTRSQRLHMLLDPQFYDSDGQLDYHKVASKSSLHSKLTLIVLFILLYLHCCTLARSQSLIPVHMRCTLH